MDYEGGCAAGKTSPERSRDWKIPAFFRPLFFSYGELAEPGRKSIRIHLTGPARGCPGTLALPLPPFWVCRSSSCRMVVRNEIIRPLSRHTSPENSGFSDAHEGPATFGHSIDAPPWGIPVLLRILFISLVRSPRILGSRILWNCDARAFDIVL